LRRALNIVGVEALIATGYICADLGSGTLFRSRQAPDEVEIVQIPTPLGLGVSSGSTRASFRTVCLSGPS
jgi:hypothetical protein